MRSTASTKARDGLSTDEASLARARRPSLLIALAYAVVSSLWIFFSDRLIEAAVSDPGTLTDLQTMKGWAFVLVSSVGLFLLINKTLRSVQYAAVRQRSSDEMLRGIVENSPLGIVVVDERGTYVRVNEAFAEMLGYTEEELEGTASRDVTFPDDRDATDEMYRRLRAGPERRVALEKRYVRSDGRVVWAHVSGTLLDVDGPSYGIAVIKDITARKEREAELQQTLQALVSSDRQRTRLMEALLTAEEAERQRIAADIHDDSLQVLTSALLQLDLAMQPGTTTEERNRITSRTREQLESAMQRLRSLAFDLRPVLLEKGGLGPALQRFLAEACAERVGRSYEVSDRCSEQIPPAVATAAYRVAREAITNALQHADASLVKVALETSEGALLIEVSDDGRGFEPAEGVDSGDHMGLRLIRERAERLGGSLAIVSSPGQGMRVCVRLPLEIGAQLSLDELWEQTG